MTLAANEMVRLENIANGKEWSEMVEAWIRIRDFSEEEEKWVEGFEKELEEFENGAESEEQVTASEAAAEESVFETEDDDMGLEGEETNHVNEGVPQFQQEETRSSRRKRVLNAKYFNDSFGQFDDDGGWRFGQGHQN